jgi:hypothetical protein
MKSAFKSVLMIAAALVLGACSLGSSMLNNKSAVPQASQINVGNPLSMPPDLQLAVPNQTSDAYQANPGTGLAEDDLAAPKPVQKVAMSPMAPVPVKQDIYEQYGISKVKDDGTAKSPDELKTELKAAILAKKRLTNPGYGTIKNIGSIFSDQ